MHKGFDAPLCDLDRWLVFFLIDRNPYLHISAGGGFLPLCPVMFCLTLPLLFLNCTESEDTTGHYLHLRDHLTMAFQNVLYINCFAQSCLTYMLLLMLLRTYRL
jgi:hypothetical protein